MALLLLKIGNYSAFEYFISLMAIVYPVFIVWQSWSYAYSKENKLFLLERYYKIEKDNIIAVVDDEIISSIQMKYLIKYKLISNSYLLYISKNQFLYFPIDSFHTEDDLNCFRSEILMQVEQNKNK